MRRPFSDGETARVARRRNVRRRLPHPSTKLRTEGPAKADAKVPGSGRMEWMAPFDEQEIDALRAGWAFLE